MYRGRRHMGMGFFFAMGHSSVVVFPALLIFGGAGQSAKVPSRTSPGLGDSCRSSSPLLPASGRAGLNASVLGSLVTLWGEARAGNLGYALVDQKLASRVFIARLPQLS
jgi:high-affinity nickel-transport protein